MKKAMSFPCSITKVFDLRTLEILPYSHQFLSYPIALQLIDESRSEFFLSNIFGVTSIYSLQNGLTELQQTSVFSLAALLFLVRQHRERNGHRCRDEFLARRSLRRLHSRRNPPQRAASRLESRFSLFSVICSSTSTPSSIPRPSLALLSRFRWTSASWERSTPATRRPSAIRPTRAIRGRVALSRCWRRRSRRFRRIGSTFRGCSACWTLR